MDNGYFDRLRAKIAESRKRLDEQEHALDLVEAMAKMGDLMQPTLPSVAPAPAAVQRPTVKRIRRSAPQAAKNERPPQKQLLKEAINKLGNEEFTVNRVNEVLIESGNGFDGHKPQNRIAVLIGQLVKEKFIEQSFQGGGNVPHRFQRVEAE
jgi:hypothetical protein